MGNIRELGTEVSEAVIDNAVMVPVLNQINFNNINGEMVDDLLKDLPMLKMIAISNNIRDMIFISKLKSFLQPLEGISKSKIKKEITKIDKSRKYRKKVGENLINLIDRSFDEDNAENVAILFKAFLDSKISYDEYTIASTIACKISSRDIKRFCVDFMLIQDAEVSYDLLWTGLIDFTFAPIEGVDVDYERGGTYEDPKTGKEYDIDEGYSAEVKGGKMNVIPTETGKIFYRVFGDGGVVI